METWRLGECNIETSKLLIRKVYDFEMQMKAIFSNHALRQMEARNILIETILLVIQSPDSISKQDKTTSIYMKLIDELEKQYLYRVFVNVSKIPPIVITTYKTSKIDKYGYPLRQRT